MSLITYLPIAVQKQLSKLHYYDNSPVDSTTVVWLYTRNLVCSSNLRSPTATATLAFFQAVKVVIFPGD